MEEKGFGINRINGLQFVKVLHGLQCSRTRYWFEASRSLRQGDMLSKFNNHLQHNQILNHDVCPP